MIDKSLTLKNFEFLLSGSVLNKGHDYFENGAVARLVEGSKGLWNAVVSGSEDYKVQIHFAGKNISDCSCDCPHDAQYCKHIVAVLYAILEEGLVVPGKKNRRGASGRDWAEFVNDLAETELKQFVIEYGGNNHEFRELLLAHYAPESGSDGRTAYARLIKSAADRARGRGRYIDYHNVNGFVRDVDILLAQAQLAIKLSHFGVAAEVAFAVIENVHEILKDADDSGGSIGNCIREAFEIVSYLLKSDIPMALRQHIFSDALKEAKSAQYDYFDFDDRWLEVVVTAAYDAKSQSIALEFIDRQLADCKSRKDEWFRDYEMQRLVGQKLALLRKAGKGKEADLVRLQFLHLSEIRMGLITEKVAEKRYSEAKQLIKEGLGTAKKKDLPGTVDKYRKTLLHIAELEKDTAAFRAIARELYENGRNMEYYKVIKGTYKRKEWPAVAEEFIREIQVQHKPVAGIHFNEDARLAGIFVEEQYWGRLLELLQGSTTLHFIDSYSSWLTAKFPGEVLTVYSNALIEYASQNTGRNHYITIRERLKKMQTLEGGNEIVKGLVMQFTQRYKARKAMIEELAKINQ